MKKIFILFLMVAGLLSCTPKTNVNQNIVEKTPPSTTNQKVDSLSYSLGVLVGKNLASQGFENLKGDDLALAISHVMEGKNLLMTAEQANACVTEFQQEKAKLAFGENKTKGEAFLAENKKRPEVTTLPSGLQYEVIKEGTGAKPSATDKVTVHYHGTLIDGEVFDSSVKRGEPATFPVNGVIQGWVEGLQLMNEGSKWKLFIPYNLAYGDRGAGKNIGPFSALVFEVELLKIN